MNRLANRRHILFLRRYARGIQGPRDLSPRNVSHATSDRLLIWVVSGGTADYSDYSDYVESPDWEMPDIKR